MDAYQDQLTATLLLSLRIGPALAFAPPFTLMRTPSTVRVIVALGLSFWLVLANPGQTYLQPGLQDDLVSAALSELFLGVTLALALQLAFGAILVAGRTLDFQAGFGLSLMVDPTLRTQMPLIGTLLVYAAGALFFASNGATDLLAVWSYSLSFAPLGLYAPTGDLSAIGSYMAAAHILAISIVGGVLFCLFMIDLGLAFLSRTLPQMNALVLGFQVKTLALLCLTPLIFAFSAGLMLRLVRLAIEATPELA
jgi:flagellar biosynthetic protein FliR